VLLTFGVIVVGRSEARSIARCRTTLLFLSTLKSARNFAFASWISCSWRSSNRSCSSAGKASHVGVMILLVETSELSFEPAIEGRFDRSICVVPSGVAKKYVDAFLEASITQENQRRCSLVRCGRSAAQGRTVRDLARGGGALWSGTDGPRHRMYEAHKLLYALRMTYEQINGCPKGCVLFNKEYIEAKYCLKYKSSRFMEVDSSDGQKRQLDIPMTILCHLPFIPRIQHLYMTEESVKQITSHKNGKRYNPNKIVHTSDGEAWSHFDAIHREKVEEACNVRVALATNGFNPYGMTAAPYTCWHVFVIPINLPPTYAFKDNIFVSLIIPGHPGNKMGVYMEPLIDELVYSWEEGVWTYGRAMKTNFKMHVWYQYSMYDLTGVWAILCLVCSQ
jgi:hypothetical protein